MSDTTLRGRRHEAALASGGHSSAAIHALFKEEILDRQIGGRVLDFGAGNGDFSRTLYDLGSFHEVHAIDLMERPEGLPSPIAWRRCDLNDQSRYESETFDVVVAAEVIEHLENPRAAAREWYRLLRPGGTLLFSTPNVESIRSLTALVLRGHFVAFGNSSYPAHITALLRTDMERVAVEAGFSELSFRYTDHGGLPGRPSITWQSLSFGRLRGRWFSDNILCCARRPSRRTTG